MRLMATTKLTAKDREMASAYHRAKPAQFGDLHQRMKYLIDQAHRVGLNVHPDALDPADDPEAFSAAMHDLFNAILDLQTEVSFYRPVRPPYGQRSVRLF